jgi:hypothetical protein
VAPAGNVIHHRAVDTRAAYGEQVVLPFAAGDNGQLVAYPLSATPRPHALITGRPGSGATSLLITLAIEAARQGIEVRACDPRTIALTGLRGWPNITKIATRVADMVRLIEDFGAEMQRRYELIETGKARATDFRRLLLILDQYLVLILLVTDWWQQHPGREPAGAKAHPVIATIGQIAALSRGACMHLVIATPGPVAPLGPATLGSLGFRVSLGPLSPQAALTMWGDARTGTDTPAVPGLCMATTEHGPARATAHYVPDPAGDLTSADREHVQSLLPPGTTWNRPQPAPGAPGTGP